MKRFKAGIISFIMLFALWIFLTNTSNQEIWAGIIVSFFLTLIFSKRLEILGDIKLNPKAIIYSIIYFFVFAIALIKANFDVLKRVISPKLPIKPGIVKVKTKLKSPLGRIILANSITLTPGTLTVETKDEDFYIHWIDVTNKDTDTATKEIVHNFEKYLEVIFG